MQPFSLRRAHLRGICLGSLSAALLWVGSSAVLAEQGEMTFKNDCFGNHIESCYIIADGIITPDSPAAFDALLAEGVDGNQMLFNSEGGNLGAAVRLGRMLRDRGFNTQIGQWPDDFTATSLLPGDCLSACAYAFLGGGERRFDGSSRLGFHQFALTGSETMALGDAQALSGQLISYIIEMGADARIFTAASTEGSDSFYYVTTQEAQDLGLATPSGYGAFVLEPWGDGVVATAQRRDPPKPYDEVVQVSVLCWADTPYLWFYATGVPNYSASFYIELDGEQFGFEEGAVRTMSDDQGGAIEVKLDKAMTKRLPQARSVATGFNFGRADGGDFATRLQLEDIDQMSISAALRFCIGD